jgi:hypothetical protein
MFIARSEYGKCCLYAYETNAILIVPEQIEESSECDLADFVDGINSLQHFLA